MILRNLDIHMQKKKKPGTYILHNNQLKWINELISISVKDLKL